MLLALLGMLLTAIWLGLGAWYVGAYVGFDNLLLMLPNEIAQFIGSLMLPVIFLWLILGYFGLALRVRQVERSVARPAPLPQRPTPVSIGWADSDDGRESRDILSGYTRPELPPNEKGRLPGAPARPDGEASRGELPGPADPSPRPVPPRPAESRPRPGAAPPRPPRPETAPPPDPESRPARPEPQIGSETPRDRPQPPPAQRPAPASPRRSGGAGANAGGDSEARGMAAESFAARLRHRSSESRGGTEPSSPRREAGPFGSRSGDAEAHGREPSRPDARSDRRQAEGETERQPARESERAGGASAAAEPRPERRGPALTGRPGVSAMQEAASEVAKEILVPESPAAASAPTDTPDRGLRGNATAAQEPVMRVTPTPRPGTGARDERPAKPQPRDPVAPGPPVEAPSPPRLSLRSRDAASEPPPKDERPRAAAPSAPPAAAPPAATPSATPSPAAAEPEARRDPPRRDPPRREPAEARPPAAEPRREPMLTVTPVAKEPRETPAAAPERSAPPLRKAPESAKPLGFRHLVRITSLELNAIAMDMTSILCRASDHTKSAKRYDKGDKEVFFNLLLDHLKQAQPAEVVSALRERGAEDLPANYQRKFDKLIEDSKDVDSSEALAKSLHSLPIGRLYERLRGLAGVGPDHG